MIKRLIVSVFAFCAIALLGASPVLANADGAQVFSQNCAACHIGGGNAVNAQKTLKKDVLEQYEMFSADKIIYQVTNGKNAMPSFQGRLTDDQIAAVADYVLAQAEAGW